jgi:hypothetical protein
VTGPRIKIENGPMLSVEQGSERQYRLLIGGKNFEHVGEIQDQGETVWVYRSM